VTEQEQLNLTTFVFFGHWRTGQPNCSRFYHGCELTLVCCSQPLCTLRKVQAQDFQWSASCQRNGTNKQTDSGVEIFLFKAASHCLFKSGSSAIRCNLYGGARKQSFFSKDLWSKQGKFSKLFSFLWLKIARSGRRRRYNVSALRNAYPSRKPDSWLKPRCQLWSLEVRLTSLPLPPEENPNLFSVKPR